MSYDKPTTMERQFVAMMKACISNGVSIAFIREAADREADVIKAVTREVKIERETTAADVFATSRAIADSGPIEPATGVRRRRAAAPKKRSSS